MRASAHRISLAAALLLAGSLGLLLGGEPAGSAATAAPAAPAAECRWAETPIRIDGKADDPAWKTAAVLDGFGMPWLGKEAPRLRAGTRARLAWDREYLYFTAEMDDRDLYAAVREHDGMTWHDDVFELFFKPTVEHAGYYEFQVNAAGTKLDMFLPRRGDGGYDRYKSDGDFHLESRVELRGTLNRRSDRDRGWTVEGRIPWRDFLRTGGRPEPGEEWRFALCRYDYSADAEKPELSTTAPLTRGSFHQHEDYAPLRFVGPDRRTSAPFGIEQRIPLTTSTVIGSPDPPLPYRARRVYPNLKLSFPVTAARVPGSDWLFAITQQWPGGPSRLVRFRDDPATSAAETLLELDRTAYDLCFHPDFARNGYFYLASKGELAQEGPKRKMRISRYTLGAAPERRLDPASELPILEWPSDGHDGGAMVFGHDGMLYVTTGDGTSDSDVHVVGQDLKPLTAKVLRIDVDRPDPGRAYSVPKDNPFVGVKDARPETWAFGLRNPWRMAIDAETGRIWVGNNGQDQWETVHLLQRGANYGWSVYEGSHPFYLQRTLGPVPHTKPTLEHPHSEARSLTGGLVYYGKRFPELRGVYLYGDYSTGKIWGARHDGQRVTWHQELADTTLQITGFGLDSQGEILIADNRGGDEGAFYTFEPTPKDLPPSRFPRTLSATGLFKSVRGHEAQPALIPYSVNAPLWSDGAHKERFIALPGTESKIDFTSWRGWSFPDRTVLVKSFALDLVEGDPRSRKWVETRLLTKQDGEWVGYSYRWNDAQTEATLVESKGEDRPYEIRAPRSKENPSGVRRQVWHYPSRAECMTCHTRASNFVLGLNLHQMNRQHRYPSGVKDNQLRVLEHLGVLRVNWAEEARTAWREEGKARGMTEAQANEYADRHARSDGQRQPGPSALLAVNPAQAPRLVDPYDRKQDLALRAKSYLQGNCAGCHVEAGGGNAQMELEFATPLEKMRIWDVKPVHDTFGLKEARLVAPGRPDGSVLLHRLSHRDKGHMPPLATSRVDTEGVRLFREWIRSGGAR
ncbi:MAG: PQQ-dependent sugar dehydrogenase [Armatimonadota bacterium]